MGGERRKEKKSFLPHRIEPGFTDTNWVSAITLTINKGVTGCYSKNAWWCANFG